MHQNEGGAAAHAERNPYLAHHFLDKFQQDDAVKMGMWLFLVQELLFFGGLFMAYISMRFFYPDTFQEAYLHLDWKLGAVNTVALLTSSLTMALAVRAAQTSNKKLLIQMLVITNVLALVFMAIKFTEYNHKIHEGLVPGALYSYQTLDPIEAVHNAPQVFFSVYFMMTGVHGLHVLIGVGLIGYLTWRAMKDDFNEQNYGFVENVGLYWHLVDLIWIVLFPLLYLVK
ncbi:MAG: cytochrome c oxidase subunit 3 family protein [Myxococcota bacterium]|nr:cytochrome c oxidase subunit 3 family protein [Myxococcota bacterium]